jgi:hypothetical protein
MFDVRRREFISLLGGASVAWPLAARAQLADGVRRIGVLMPFVESDPEGQRRVNAFLQGLKELGWIRGRNVQIDYRWVAADDADRIGVYTAELVGLKPDDQFRILNGGQVDRSAQGDRSARCPRGGHFQSRHGSAGRLYLTFNRGRRPLVRRRTNRGSPA